MCYVAIPDRAAELLFQIGAGRAERAALIVTTNLPFSEWTTIIPNARLCKAMVDRLTDRAHIIETGTESYRFRRTLAKEQESKSMSPASSFVQSSPALANPRPSSLAGLGPGACFP